MSPARPLLEVSALEIGLAQRALFGGLSLTVQAGDVWCVLGPNGAGKTTLFRTLLGMVAARAGRVLIGGTPLEALGPAVRAQRVAYVPQAGAHGFAFRVHEMVLMGRTAHLGLFASPGARDHAAAAGALQKLGIAHLAERTVDTLSGGEQCLTMIARALAQEAPLLILDEPAAHLDMAHQALILGVIRRLASDARAVIFSTHDPSHALECATHALLVRQGQVPLHGPVADVLTEATLSGLYDTPMAFFRDAQGRVAACRAQVTAGATR